jgi:hypothetical protein
LAGGAELGDLIGVGSNDDLIELRAAERGSDDPGEQRLAA